MPRMGPPSGTARMERARRIQEEKFMNQFINNRLFEFSSHVLGM